VEGLPVERAAGHVEVVPELFDHVGHHPVVGRRRRAQDRHARGQKVEHPLDSPVVGSEVVAPVADAVCLVHDEQPDRSHELWKHVLAKAPVVEALR